MSRNIELLLAGSLLMVLGACTTALPPEKTEALGAPFNEELKDRYLELAASRRSSLDFDYFHFRRKAEASLLGDVVEPDEVAEHDIKLAWQPDALAAREKLVALLDNGSQFQSPGTAAQAQVDFDCWLDELEAQSAGADDSVSEASPAPEASQCGTRLMTSLEALGSEQGDFNVFFASGSSGINAEGETVIAEVKRSADLLQPARILVTGYADRRGVAADNERLAEQRAREVAKALIAEGVPAAVVTVDVWGETVSAESLDENRRVEIVFQN